VGIHLRERIGPQLRALSFYSFGRCSELADLRRWQLERAAHVARRPKQKSQPKVEAANDSPRVVVTKE
jgi:hypothetical protein